MSHDRRVSKRSQCEPHSGAEQLHGRSHPAGPLAAGSAGLAPASSQGRARGKGWLPSGFLKLKKVSFSLITQLIYE